MTETGDTTKQCFACGADISAAARKCTECGSDQTWMRHVGQTSVIVGTVSAIASLMVLAGSHFYEFVVPKRGNLSLSVLEELQYDSPALEFRCTGPRGEKVETDPYIFGPPSIDVTLPVIATNDGRAPLQISSGSITFLTGGIDNNLKAEPYGFAEAVLTQPIDLLPNEGKVLPLKFRVTREWNDGFGWAEYPLFDKIQSGERLDFGKQRLNLNIIYTSVQGQAKISASKIVDAYARRDADIKIDGRPLDPQKICLE